MRFMMFMIPSPANQARIEAGALPSADDVAAMAKYDQAMILRQPHGTTRTSVTVR